MKIVFWKLKRSFLNIFSHLKLQKNHENRRKPLQKVGLFKIIALFHRFPLLFTLFIGIFRHSSTFFHHFLLKIDGKLHFRLTTPPFSCLEAFSHRFSWFLCKFWWENLLFNGQNTVFMEKLWKSRELVKNGEKRIGAESKNVWRLETLSSFDMLSRRASPPVDIQKPISDGRLGFSK